MYRVLPLFLLTVLALMASPGSRAGERLSHGEPASAIAAFMHKGDTPAASVRAGRAVWSRRHAQRFLKAGTPRTDTWAVTEVPAGLAGVPRPLGRQTLWDPQIACVDGRHAFGLPDFFP